MTDISQLEREVGEARQRVAADVALLFDGETWSQSTDVLKAKALHYKDQAVDAVRGEAQSRGSELYELMRDKVANNPIAAGAIVAGLAWRLFRHPPIATALVAGGIYGLTRTDRDDDSWSAPRLVEAAQHRLEDAVDTVKSKARDVTEDAFDAASEMKDTVERKVRNGTGDLYPAEMAPSADSLLLAGAALALGAAVAISQKHA